MPNTESKLIQFLQDPARFDHPTERFEVIETHISWVLLTGPYAYKIKKPVDLGFLDFTTLEARHFYCQEELRLNRRFAPQLYLDIVPITGSQLDPILNGKGPFIEYVVKMKEFAQKDRLDRVLARKELSSQHIDQLAQILAEFHGRAAVANADAPFGTPERILQPVEECFEQMRPLLPKDQESLAKLEAWCQQEFKRLRKVMKERKLRGFIRECHGDAHLANMVLLAGEVVLFDCIEFSENLRWIDVISEVAFVTMDLDDRKASPLANRFLNRYLEHTGDYAGLRLLRFFQVYRALVRAKIAAIRLDQEGDKNQATQDESGTYLALAESYIQAHKPSLIITHGPSGTGKTWLTDLLMEHRAAIRLRTDVERKRRFHLKPADKSDPQLKTRMYDASVTQELYRHLADQARQLLRAGFSVIVDGTFLKRWQREIFRDLATAQKVPFKILELKTCESTMRQRIRERHRQARDASEADLKILEEQLISQEPLGPRDQQDVISVNTDKPFKISQLLKQLPR